MGRLKGSRDGTDEEEGEGRASAEAGRPMNNTNEMPEEPPAGADDEAPSGKHSCISASSYSEQRSFTDPGADADADAVTDADADADIDAMSRSVGRIENERLRPLEAAEDGRGGLARGMRRPDKAVIMNGTSNTSEQFE